MQTPGIKQTVSLIEESTEVSQKAIGILLKIKNLRLMRAGKWRVTLCRVLKAKTSLMCHSAGVTMRKSFPSKERVHPQTPSISWLFQALSWQREQITIIRRLLGYHWRFCWSRAMGIYTVCAGNGTIQRTVSLRSMVLNSQDGWLDWNRFRDSDGQGDPSWLQPKTKGWLLRQNAPIFHISADQNNSISLITRKLRSCPFHHTTLNGLKR